MLETKYYWSNNLDKNEQINIKVEFRGEKYDFHSSNGVFSKQHFDDGSKLLLDTALIDGIKGDILDLGCGYGVIGILLALNCDCKVTMCDINERAINLAQKNIKKFRLDNRVSSYVSNITKDVVGDFDAIITNPPIRIGNEILFNFFSESQQKLREGGVFYAVLRKKQGAETYTKKINEIFGNAEVIDKKHGFWIVKAVKQ